MRAGAKAGRRGCSGAASLGASCYSQRDFQTLPTPAINIFSLTTTRPDTDFLCMCTVSLFTLRSCFASISVAPCWYCTLIRVCTSSTQVRQNGTLTHYPLDLDTSLWSLTAFCLCSNTCLIHLSYILIYSEKVFAKAAEYIVTHFPTQEPPSTTTISLLVEKFSAAASVLNGD